MLRWTSLFTRRLPKGVRRKRRAEPAFARRLTLEPLEDRRMLAVITVDSPADDTNDDGMITLREAIVAANNNAIADATEATQAGEAGLDTIRFNIPGDGPHTISPMSIALPAITEPVTIDGYSQPGATTNTHGFGSAINALLRIELNGTMAGASSNGLTITAGGSTVRGLVINRFSGDGIRLSTADGNTIAGNFIGTDLTGEGKSANGGNGIFVDGIADNTIGGIDPSARNLISGNDLDGVHFGNATGSNATGNMVLGNLIGTDVNGTSNLGNSANGVFIEGVSNNVIGGTTTSARNVISGNNNEGVRIEGESAFGNIVQGNFIGTDISGTVALGNSQDGIEIAEAHDNLVGGVAPGAGNVIAFNGSEGVEVQDDTATGNAIRRNSIFQNNGIGIDLQPNAGMTSNDVNDPDLSANNLQNFPEFVGDAVLDGNLIEITYAVPSTPGNSTYPLEIEFFVADSDAEEGQVYFGSDTYVAADATNNKTITIPAIAALASARIVATATDALGNTSEFSDDIAVVKLPDRFENNDTLADATRLGSEPTVIEQDLNLHELVDEDFFRYTAHDTGKLIVRTLFVHDAGDLSLEIVDRFGNVIAMADNSSSTANFEELIIPVVSQQMYFIHVAAGGALCNIYDLEIENFPAPIQQMPTLHPDDDNGISNTDNITDVTDPRIFIQADLDDFAQMDIEILSAADAAAGMTAGAAVEVFVNGISQGFADAVGASNSLFQFQLDSLVLQNGIPVNGGTLNFIAAAVRVIDGQLDGPGGDPAMIGGRSQLSKQLELRTVDVTGPRVENVTVTGFDDFDLFGLKPDATGPTPLVESLTVEFTPPFDPVSATNPGHYSLIGDANGPILIASVNFVAPNQVQLIFAQPLPDDRFTFTIFDSLTDLSGNALDGESQAAAPGGAILLPSGDGVPGGDFVARLTVDSRAEIGTWAAGTAIIDTNGNLFVDSENVDSTNRDMIYHLGFPADNIFAGNFVESRQGIADQFDKLAAYGRVGNQWRWMIDTDNDGVPNVVRNDPLNINGLPVAGNFDNVAANGDEVGVFDGTTWYFDTNHDFRLDAASAVTANYRGLPIVGDFDGNGIDDLGTYTAAPNRFGGNLFSIDLNRTGAADRTFRVGLPNAGQAGGFNGFPGVRERPIAADFDGDQIDDIGLWVPDGSVLVPGDEAEWYVFLSAHDSLFSRINNTITFTPTPFGNDLFAQYGNSFAVPIVGNFDPPAAAGSGITTTVTIQSKLPTTSGNSPVDIDTSPKPTIEPEIQTAPIVVDTVEGDKQAPDRGNEPHVAVVDDPVETGVTDEAARTVPNQPPKAEVETAISVDSPTDESASVNTGDASSNNESVSIENVSTIVVPPPVIEPAAPRPVVAEPRPAVTKPRPAAVEAEVNIVASKPTAKLNSIRPSFSMFGAKVWQGLSNSIRTVIPVKVPPASMPKKVVKSEVGKPPSTMHHLPTLPAQKPAKSDKSASMLQGKTKNHVLRDNYELGCSRSGNTSETRQNPNSCESGYKNATQKISVNRALGETPSNFLGRTLSLFKVSSQNNVVTRPQIPSKAAVPTTGNERHHELKNVPISLATTIDRSSTIEQSSRQVSIAASRPDKIPIGSVEPIIKKATGAKRTLAAPSENRKDDPVNLAIPIGGTPQRADGQPGVFKDTTSLTHNDLIPDQKQASIADAAFETDSVFEPTKVDAEVVDNLRRLRQGSTEEVGSRIQHELFIALNGDLDYFR